MNSINPYRRNCEIMRKFFSKPIFLLLGIVFSLSILSDIVMSVLNSAQGSISIQIGILNILPIIAFFMFYFKSRNRSPFVSFNAPITLMKVYSIINIVIAGLGIILAILVLLCDVALQSATNYMPFDLSAFFDILTPLYIFFVTPETIISLVFSIAMLLFFNSIKKSVSTIYLQRKGSVFFAVTAILTIIYSIYAIIVTPFFLKDFIDSITSIAHSDSLYYNVNIPVDMNSTMLVAIISYGVKIVTALLFVVLGIMYNSYIKKLSTSIGDENKQVHFSTPPVTPDVPNGEFVPMNIWNNASNNIPREQSPVNSWNDKVSVDIWNQNPVSPARETPVNSVVPPTQDTPPVKPVEFDPKPVFINENPYTDKVAPQVDVTSPKKPTSKFCSNCGKENSSECMFCGGCGTKLK